ncbi:MAG TPA: hypothetical protein VFB79_02005 [Candidatus Angelobacter sp.]|nr:hypothetical protein [Candidatus Angelobacter sp.]
MNREKPFVTGAIAPVTGIYRVIHVAHRLPHEVIISSGHHFPRCAKCADAVLFDLVHPAPDLFLHHGTRQIYELDVMDDEPTASVQEA